MEDLEESQEEDQPEDENNEEGAQTPGPGDGTTPSRRRRKQKEKKKGCCANFKKPEWFVRLSDKTEKMVEHPIFEKLIIILILINTVILASEQYGAAEWLITLQDIANLFFTIIFALEMILKLIGFGCKKYVSDGFNIFDAFIVIMSYVELFIPGEDSSLSVLRAFRLLRIFKIIKSWKSLRILLSTVLDSLTAITNLGVLIILYLFISALLTKQFYTDKGALYDINGDPSRYDFTTTGSALVAVFIILTGENWNEIMVQVIKQQENFGPAVFFILIMVIGNFMLLNLFLAILLKSISQIGEKDNNAEAQPAVKAEKKDATEGEEKGEGEDQDEAEEVEEEVDSHGCSHGNESMALNSSNSNIEEEFEQIKN